jgi:hypothetical protein
MKPETRGSIRLCASEDMFKSNAVMLHVHEYEERLRGAGAIEFSWSDVFGPARLLSHLEHCRPSLLTLRSDQLRRADFSCGQAGPISHSNPSTGQHGRFFKLRLWKNTRNIIFQTISSHVPQSIPKKFEGRRQKKRPSRVPQRPLRPDVPQISSGVP